MRIALELAKENRVYEGLATKFFQHYVYVAAAMKHMGSRDYQLWDEQDGFFYDVLRYPDGRFQQVPRPLAGRPDPAVRRRAAGGDVDRAVPRVHARTWTGSSSNRRDLVAGRRPHRRARRPDDARADDRQRGPAAAAAASGSGTRTSSSRDYGIRSLSKAHEAHPFEFDGQDGRLRAGRGGRRRSRAATRTGAGRSGSRPRFLLIESLRKLGKAYGADFTVPAAGRAAADHLPARWPRSWPTG